MSKYAGHHHYHVVQTGTGAVLPDSIDAYQYAADALAAVVAIKAAMRDEIGADERLRGTVKRDGGFWVETDTVGRNRYVVYIESCDDTQCDVWRTSDNDAALGATPGAIR